MSGLATPPSVQPLRANRQLLTLLAVQSLGMVARGIFFVGLPLFVLERTGSALSMSISLLLSFAPFTVAGPFAGQVVDRFSRRDLLVLSNLVYGALLFPLPFVHATYLVYAVAFAASLCGVVMVNALVALIPELVDLSQLAKANSVYTFLRSATYLVSTSATFLLIKVMGKADIFFLCSALLAVCGISCLPVRRDRPHPRTEEAAAGGGAGPGGFREVLRIMTSDRHVRGLTLMHLMFMPIFGAFEVLLPLFCDRSLGDADYYTLLSAAVGAGLALGSLFTYRLLERVRPLSLVLASFCGYAAGVFLLTRSGVLSLSLLVSFSMGMIDAFGFTTYEFLRQRVVPSAYRGRVFAVMDALVLLPLPLGYLFIGYFGERASIGALGAWLCAAGLALALLCLPFTRNLPSLDQRNPAANTREADTA